MMKSPRSRTVISVSLVLLLLAFLSGCQTESQPPLNYTGSGTASNPYVISDAQALVGVAHIITDSYTYSDNAQLGAYIELGADIDMSNITETESGNWTPIGKYGEASVFSGSFDGNGHEIRNLKIHLPDTDYGGLFGYTRNATIMDVKLVDADVEGQSSVGALIGYAESTDISRCSSDGTVSGQEYVVGGLVGEIDAGSLSFCSSSATVSCVGEGGGLVGYVGSSSSISSCFASGTVTGKEGDGSGSCGGLIGFSQGSDERRVIVSTSYATGDVSGIGRNTGGLIGFAEETKIEKSYATGTISGSVKCWRSCGACGSGCSCDFLFCHGECNRK